MWIFLATQQSKNITQRVYLDCKQMSLSQINIASIKAVMKKQIIIA